jgi:Kef-type K+ transport system membrane component KefB
MVLIFALPILIWRIAKNDQILPLVVVQIITGIVLGPGLLGSYRPDIYNNIFSPQIIISLNGISWWAVMIYVWVAGIELDFKSAWNNRMECSVTVSLALGAPLLLGGVAAIGMLMYTGWIGNKANNWQFIVCIGTACAITALPILMLFMEKLDILRQPIGQRILQYASLDDLVTWIILAIIQLDFVLLSKQCIFLILFISISFLFRRLMWSLEEKNRWFIGIIWLILSSYASEWAGLHFMFGAFLAGVSLDKSMFNQQNLDQFRDHIMMAMMPVFFISTGLRTEWSVGSGSILLAASVLLLASVGGKKLGLHIASRLLKWKKGESSIIGWLLQTKALIMIIFANILLDKQIISNDTFTALLIMAVFSTMLTMPMATSVLSRMNKRSTHLSQQVNNEGSSQ